MGNHSFLTQLTMARANIQAATDHLNHALAMSEAKVLKWSTSHSLQTIRKNLKRQLRLLRNNQLIADAALNPDEAMLGYSLHPQDSEVPSVKSPSPQDAPPADLS